MNLDDFKIQLNKQLEGSPNFEMPATQHTNFNAIKTTSVIQKIKKSIAIEMVFGVVCILLFMFVILYTQHTSIKIYFGIFSILIMLITALLFLLLLKTKKLSNSSVPIKQNLTTLYHILNEFVKLYFQFTMLLIPVCIVLATYLSYSELQNQTLQKVNIFDTFLKTKYWYILLSTAVLFCVFMYYFTKWYLKKMYGNHLTHLKQMLNDIDL